MQIQLPTLVSEYNSDDTITPDVPMQIKQSSLDTLPSSNPELEDSASIATSQHRLSTIAASIKSTADIKERLKREYSQEESESDYSDLSENMRMEIQRRKTSLKSENALEDFQNRQNDDDEKAIDAKIEALREEIECYEQLKKNSNGYQHANDDNHLGVIQMNKNKRESKLFRLVSEANWTADDIKEKKKEMNLLNCKCFNFLQLSKI